eukprot:5692520-Amphidinium_carterae.1
MSFTNSFKGTLPEVGIRSMSTVTELLICVNSFEGALPAGGLQVMRAVYAFYVSTNRFAGTLPTDGVRALAGLDVLSVENNDFEGEMSEAQCEHRFVVLSHLCCFPESRLHQIKIMKSLIEHQCCVWKTLYLVWCVCPGQSFGLCFCKGSLNLLISTGAIPSSLPVDVQVVGLSHNLLGGPLPERLFKSCEKVQKCVVADTLAACHALVLDSSSKGWIIVPRLLVFSALCSGDGPSMSFIE